MMVTMACETKHRRCGMPCFSGCHIVGRSPRRCHCRPAGGPGRQDVVGRYYDPQTGQFLSVDPMVAKTQQAYLYAGDDPVVLTDSTGQSVSDELYWSEEASAFRDGFYYEIGHGDETIGLTKMRKSHNLSDTILIADVVDIGEELHGQKENRKAWKEPVQRCTYPHPTVWVTVVADTGKTTSRGHTPDNQMVGIINGFCNTKSQRCPDWVNDVTQRY